MSLCLYRFYDPDNQLLYVGITQSPEARINAHKSDKPWWGEVVAITIDRDFADRAELAAAEVKAIQTERPKYNRAHVIGRQQPVKVHTLRPHRSRHAKPIWSEPSAFGNVQPEYALGDRPRRLHSAMYCPDCAARTVARPVGDDGTREGDWDCASCGTTWTDREWEIAQFGRTEIPA